MGPLGFLILLCSLTYVFANTEIINFEAKESAFEDLQFTESWPILSTQSSTLQWNLTAAQSGFLSQEICPNLEKWRPDAESSKLCPHELWVVLDLDESQWKNFGKFTLRFSWPAFYPTDISMKIYDPSSLHASSETHQSTLSHTTRRKYARIRLSFAGVLTPPASSVVDDVPFILVLEPLYLGVLPQSVLPTVCAILSIIVFGIPVAMKFNAMLQPTVQLAKQTKLAYGKVE